ncbi:ATP-grasp domain-containing protein [Stackebrandtia endophytica]|uniref:ATP-grasp domain-containing protein n=1 Tax=Stackebrandtia endophytica TaxID=1496996 RepID=A0A543AQQ5_9ACTN|nr:ATP-grasp domain-containing protein [Stackebrandtia endophytica]TQL74899.1 ATP-grasp domain-containing protein [Stackebrandtia endophytica]
MSETTPESASLTDRPVDEPAADPVLIVQPYDVHLQAAIGLGVPVVALYHRDRRHTTIGRRLTEIIPSIDVDLDDTAAVEAALVTARDRHGVRRVAQFSDEHRMEGIAEAAEAAGLVTEPPQAYRNLNNKAAFLEVGSRAAVVHRSWCSAEQRDGRERVERTGAPWVLKPVADSGSRGIRYAEDWSRLEPHLSGDGWVLEQYLSGTEYSVETLTVAGVHHTFGITEKSTTGSPRFIERAHRFPAVLDESVEAAILATVHRFLDAAGYRNGPAHTEVLVHADGIDCIESQARMGGDRIPTLIARATGVSPEVELIRSLTPDWTPPERTPRSRAGIRFVELPYGTLRSTIGLSPDTDGLEIHAIAKPGDTLELATSSNRRHVGVIAEDADPSSRPLRAVVMAHDRPAPTLVLFGGTDEQVAQCLALGHEIVLVQAHDQLTEYQSTHCSGYVICDLGSGSNVDWAATQLAEFADLPFVSVRQYGVLFRALVCERLGLDPLAATGCSIVASDKGQLRRRVDQLGLPRPDWTPVSSDEDVRRFCMDHDGRAVLKIARGTGGVGVHTVTTDRAVSLRALRSRVDDVLPQGVSTGGFLVEEQLEGRLFSLESVWVRGVHVPLGVTTTEVSSTSSAELRHTFPGELAARHVRSAVEQTGRLFGSIGMYSGGTHVEFIISNGVPMVIDAHDRPAGGHIPELIENAFGVSSTNLALAAQTGQLTVDDARRLRTTAVSVVRFITTVTDRRVVDSARLRRAVDDTAAMADVVHVHFDVNGPLLPAELDNWTRPGYVITVAESASTAEKSADAACALLTAELLRASSVNR